MAKSPQQKAKLKLDEVFSLYIRLRDSNDDGNVKCISCSFVGFWYKDKIQNGHYISRGILKTRFNEQNCNGQCASCNLWKSKNEMQFCYREGLIDKIGSDDVEKLEASRHDIMKVDIHWYNEKIEYYKNEVKRLKKGKNL